MASYHKPKMFRSLEGCCICKAKSSSSRFTDSGKYENSFRNCFKLKVSRSGDICNACVLIVKRWRNLPPDTAKDWAHVVNSRSGPGNKVTISKVKKVEEVPVTVEKFEKIRRKKKKSFVFKKPRGIIKYQRVTRLLYDIFSGQFHQRRTLLQIFQDSSIYLTGKGKPFAVAWFT